MELKLAKRWKNHPAGTILTSVSDDIVKELKKLKVLETAAKKPSIKKEEKTKSVKSSPVNKMIGESPEKKEEGEAKSPSYLEEK